VWKKLLLASLLLKVLLLGHDVLELCVELQDLRCSVFHVAIALCLLNVGVEHVALEVGVVRTVAVILVPCLALSDLLGLLGADDDTVLTLSVILLLRVVLLLDRGSQLKEDEVVLLASDNKEEQRETVHLSYIIQRPSSFCFAQCIWTTASTRAVNLRCQARNWRGRGGTPPRPLQSVFVDLAVKYFYSPTWQSRRRARASNET